MAWVRRVTASAKLASQVVTSIPAGSLTAFVTLVALRWMIAPCFARPTYNLVDLMKRSSTESSALKGTKVLIKGAFYGILLESPRGSPILEVGVRPHEGDTDLFCTLNKFEGRSSQASIKYVQKHAPFASRPIQLRGTLGDREGDPKTNGLGAWTLENCEIVARSISARGTVESAPSGAQ